MIHKRINDRMNWLKELWDKTKDKFPDEEVARIVYRRLVFEEK